MSREEIDEYFFKEGLVRFDETPCRDFHLESDLTPERWSQFAHRAGIPEDLEPLATLENLHLVKAGEMTHAGSWLLADDITRFTLRARVTGGDKEPHPRPQGVPSFFHRLWIKSETFDRAGEDPSNPNTGYDRIARGDVVNGFQRWAPGLTAGRAVKFSVTEFPDGGPRVRAAVRVSFSGVEPASIVRPGASFHRGYRGAGRPRSFS